MISAHFAAMPETPGQAEQLWLNVLLNDTSTATGQAGIWTHILTTPELESNALDRSGHGTRKKQCPNLVF